MRRLGILSALIATFAIAAPVDDYPSYVTSKTLYAKNDLRGKKAPKLVIEQWLSGDAPKTEGKVIVIDLWATWCGPCRELIPEMNQWAAKFKEDVVFIGISDEKSEVVKKFMEDTKMAYHVGIDTKKTLNKELGVQGIPHCLVISPDGVVRWQGWPQDEKDRLTDKVIEQIVAASKAKS